MDATFRNRLVVAALLSCVAAGCGGATDSRLVGAWENRQGFAKSTRMVLTAAGDVTVATRTNQQTSDPLTGSWRVLDTSGSDQLTIRISLDGRGSQTRTVKFLNDDLIEMADAGGAHVRRFTRVEK
jgi:uncharacterized lipoprotein NlpE involved in copper resistance